MLRDRRTLSTVGQLTALAAVYAGTARLGLMLDAVSGFATLVWAPTGISLAALLLFGNRLAPGVFLGAFLVNWWTGASVLVALGIATGNTMEAVLGAWVMRRLSGFVATFDRLRHVLGLILGAAAASTLVSATLGVSSLFLGGVIRSGPQAFETWRAWWVGDALGNLVVAPLLLAWARKAERFELRAIRVAEGGALTALLILACHAVFFRPAAPLDPFTSPYVLFPLFVWAALRFGLRGGTLATALASSLAIWGTARGAGPFARDALASALLTLQTFMGCAALTPLVVAGTAVDNARLLAHLRAAIHARDDFLATAGHELKTPLAALLLQIQGLRRSLRNNPQAPVGDRLAKAESAGLRLERLVNELLDVSRITTGKLRLELELVDLTEVVKDVLARFADASASARSRVALRYDGPLDGLWDRLRIEQVASNLVDNAVKYGQGRPVEVDVRREDGVAVLRVTDHGVGIDEDHQKKIFQRFERAVTTREFSGFGLGLWISRQIVEASGGRIEVESTPGAGATFTVRLPVRKEGQEQPAPDNGHGTQ